MIKNPLFITCKDFVQKFIFPELWKQTECSITPSIYVVFGQFMRNSSAFLLNLSYRMETYRNGLLRNSKLFYKLFFNLRRVYIQKCLQFVHFNLLRESSTRFVLKTEISLANFLIPSFTCSMTYNVLSICSDFNSIFLQMKLEMDRKSNMLFCYCHREHYWFLRLCASNAKPYGISEGQISTL